LTVIWQHCDQQLWCLLAALGCLKQLITCDNICLYSDNADSLTAAYLSA